MGWSWRWTGLIVPLSKIRRVGLEVGRHGVSGVRTPSGGFNGRFRAQGVDLWGEGQDVSTFRTFHLMRIRRGVVELVSVWRRF